MEQPVKDIGTTAVESTTPVPASKPVETVPEVPASKTLETVPEEATKPVVSTENENPKSEESAKFTENETSTNGDSNGAETNQNDASKGTVDDDFTDAMMENLQNDYSQDVDGMVSLMESAEDFMFESDDKQLNIKAAIEANKRKKEQESKSLVNSDKSEAYSLLAQGKRNLFVKDYESAVTTLGEACQKLASIYGDFAVELADAYMTYGNALLELWRVEEADKKNNEDESAEIGENVEEENEDETENDTTADEKKPSDGETKPDENKENEEGDDEKEEDENEERNEDGEEDLENEDDNVQIAWEVVELAKEIYIRHNDNVNAAKAYLKLGEISIASGNYSLAIEDLTRSLDFQKNITPADNRLKANAHFNLYVAYSASHEYDKSAEQLDTAKSVFETQVYDLSQKLKTIDKSNVSEIAKITKEISDTEEIMRDMDSKVLENNKHKRELMTALVEAIKKKTPEESSSSSSTKVDLKISTSSSNNLISTSSSNNIFGGSSSSNVPVNSINHLIRKKPKEKIEPSVDKNHSQPESTTKTEAIVDKNHTQLESTTKTEPSADKNHSQPESTAKAEPSVDKNHSQPESTAKTEPSVEANHTQPESTTKTEPSADKDHSQPEQSTATLNGESSLSSKLVTNSDSETSASATIVTEKINGEETNERKRKLSESGDRSPKKVCLETE